MKKRITPQQHALRWIVGRDTGISSETIWAVMMRVPRTALGYSSHPSDPADLGRCLRLLARIPSWRRRLDEMKRVSPYWRALVNRWDELEACMRDEVGIDWSTGREAPRTWDLMQAIFAPVSATQNAKRRTARWSRK